MFEMKIDMDTSAVHRMLDEMQRNIERVSGPHEVALNDLMTPEFVQAHSRFASKDEFFAAIGIEDTVFVEMSDEEQNELTRRHTTFSTWEELISDAGARYIEKQILS